MPTVHDIFLRAYAVAADQKKGGKGESRGGNDPKWPVHALVVDTETRITADQSLTLGVYRLCKLTDDKYRVTQEGLFYADDLRVEELKVLKTYRRTAVSDVKSFPPQFSLHSRSEFMKKVFYPAMKRDGALVCGLNLPFDLSRLALDWGKAGKGGSDDRSWSLTMVRYPNGEENKNCRRVIIKPIDSKKAFISLAPEWVPKGRTREWKHEPHFLDLRTLGWALFNQSFSLERLCQQLKTEHQKLDHEPTGEVTPEEIEYARQDGRCTLDALNTLKQEFDKHPTALKPYNAYSPASVAKSYLEAMGITRPAVKFKISNREQGIAMQSYYGGRSETRIRCADVPVVPVDFTSEYPTSCALLGLFDVLTAERVTFEDDTENTRRLLASISREDCFKPAIWGSFKFFALVLPNDDILPVRTVYDGVTQNIGNNYLTSDTPLWFAGCDLIASIIRTGKVPHTVRAIRLVPHGKQAGMRSVNLRGSMVEIDPYKDDLFRKVIEQRKLHKTDEALYYWLKILANSIYGFFVELIPEIQNKNVPVRVFSGEKKFPDSSDVLENPGQWFCPALASLITSAGRLLLAMTEASVQEKQGTYLFCDTDSLAIVSSEKGGSLDIPGSEGVRIMTWKEVQGIVDAFVPLNPYDPKAVKGSILNLVDANHVDSDSTKPQRQLFGYSIAVKRYTLSEKLGDKNIKIVDPKAHGIGFLYPPKDSSKDWDEDIPQWIYEMWDYVLRGALDLPREAPSWLDVPQMMRLTITTYNVLDMLGKWEIARPYNFLFLPMVDPTVGHAFDKRANEDVLLVCQFSSKQDRWFEMECVNVHSGKAYRMVDCTQGKSLAHNVVIPSQFARLLVQYQEHPESKSLAPDGMQCQANSRGLLQRAHIVAGDLRYVGKETDRKWEEGDDPSILEFQSTEYGRATKVVASEEVKADIAAIGINECARESGFDRKNFIRKLLRGWPVKRNSYNEFLRWLQTYKSRVKDNRVNRDMPRRSNSRKYESAC
ncbi:MAG TPA: hypothetical protein VK763_04445 [Terriglobales bacterium]|jgi:hypothetical protein|nr:hypothetical protein [Terriglobales bacterium]